MTNDTKTAPKGKRIAQTDKFKEGSKLDKKIPESLLMKYQNKWYVLKAGLEYKAHMVYKGGNWGVMTNIEERKAGYVLAKAVFTHMGEPLFSNYGEASLENVQNKNMHKYLLHLAVTRAECRVLRMATASAYVSAEEMDWYGENGKKELPESENDHKPATSQQMRVLDNLKITEKPKTQKEAKELIAGKLSKK